jgi:hypothetical protein
MHYLTSRSSRLPACHLQQHWAGPDGRDSLRQHEAAVCIVRNVCAVDVHAAMIATPPELATDRDATAAAG